MRVFYRDRVGIETMRLREFDDLGGVVVAHQEITLATPHGVEQAPVIDLPFRIQPARRNCVRRINERERIALDERQMRSIYFMYYILVRIHRNPTGDARDGRWCDRGASIA